MSKTATIVLVIDTSEALRTLERATAALLEMLGLNPS